MATVTHANIHVQNGQETGDSSRMALHVLPKRGLRAGETLVMFLDFPEAPANVCADVMKVLQEGYANAPGGVTSALRLAIKLANDRLINANRGAPKPMEGSITCAVVGESSVVLAQCGPALAYVRTHEGVFERIEPQGAAAEQQVGRSSTIDIFFDNVAHQEGTIYVLTGVYSYPQQNDRMVAACMGKGDAETVAAFLNVNVKQSIAGMVFEVLQGEPAVVVEEVRSARPARPTRPETTDASPIEQSEPKAAKSGRPKMPTAARKPMLSPELQAGVSQAFRSMRDGLATLGGRMLPDPAAAPPSLPERVRSKQFLTVAAMVLLPIIIVSVAVPLYLEFSGEAQRRETKRTIEAQLAAAQQAREPADVRMKWATLQQQVSEYAVKYPEYAADFSEVQVQARGQLDALAKIVRVAAVPIVQFEAVGRNRVASSAMGAYVLNTDVGTANYLPLNDDHTALAPNGRPVSLQFIDVDEVNRGLTDIVWATNSESRWRTEGAVLFGSQGVYEYSSATTRASPWKIAAADETRPARTTAGEIYNGTIYLLDGEIGQIWKYVIGGESLKSEAPYFRSAFESLKGAIDLGIDGAVYVLTQNGTVQKFFNKAPQPFSITGLPEPIGRAAALVVTGGDPERGNVYVLDAQAGSVLEFDKKGVFVRQYRGVGDEFVDATDLAVDTARRTGYVVMSQRLYTFKLQTNP
jgi:outer membrane protein assembly factor BamB